MLKYRLFSARDGDVIEEIISAPDDDEARVIAAHRIVESFGLETESRDFDEVTADTDGAILDYVRDPTMADTAFEWANAQVTFLNFIERQIDEGSKGHVRSCISAILAMMMALDGSRHQSA